MTIISHRSRADVPVIIIDQGRLTGGLGLQELYFEINREAEKQRQLAHDAKLLRLATIVDGP